MVLADNGHEVRLWSHNEDQVNEINALHTNEKYLPKCYSARINRWFASLLEDALDGM